MIIMIWKVSDQLMKMLGLTLPPLPSLKQKSDEPVAANVSPVVAPPSSVDVVPGFNPSEFWWKPAKIMKLFSTVNH